MCDIEILRQRGVLHESRKSVNQTKADKIVDFLHDEYNRVDRHDLFKPGNKLMRWTTKEVMFRRSLSLTRAFGRNVDVISLTKLSSPETPTELEITKKQICNINRELHEASVLPLCLTSIIADYATSSFKRELLIRFGGAYYNKIPFHSCDTIVFPREFVLILKLTLFTEWTLSTQSDTPMFLTGKVGSCDDLPCNHEECITVLGCTVITRRGGALNNWCS
jgi:hypothetical protein